MTPYQLPLRFRIGSEAEETRAIQWHAMRLLRAEAMCGSELASRHPRQFLERVRLGISSSDCCTDLVVEMYRAAAKAKQLDEPIWSEWMMRGRSAKLENHHNL